MDEYSRYWHDDKKLQAITLANVDQVEGPHMASLGHNELIKNPKEKSYRLYIISHAIKQNLKLASCETNSKLPTVFPRHMFLLYAESKPDIVNGIKAKLEDTFQSKHHINI